MKIVKIICLCLFVIGSIISCKTEKKEDIATIEYQCPMKCEGDKVYHEEGTCPVCKMELLAYEPRIEKTTEISDMSIYNLPSKWTNQDNQAIELKELQGNVVVMVMIYTSCQAACPRLAADMRAIEKQIPNTDVNKLKMILVSIDPKTDTPERLKKFALENEMDSDRWVFLKGSEADTREFAAVLAVNYKQISPMDFSHSNLISVFDQKGELVYQKEGLGVNHEKTVNTILELLE